ncbi:MAG: hypothetical protein ACPLPR_01115 [Bacillota bacterium]
MCVDSVEASDGVCDCEEVHDGDGSAKKEIRSDLIVWRASFSRRAQDLTGAYALLKQDMTVSRKRERE